MGFPWAIPYSLGDRPRPHNVISLVELFLEFNYVLYMITLKNQQIVTAQVKADLCA